MLMQPRHHFAPFTSGEVEPQTSTFYNSQQFSAPDNNSQPLVFTDPFSQQPAYQQQPMMSNQGYQDWQMYPANSMSQGQARKRFRPNERNFSNEIQKSPAYPHHLPTPSNTPTRPAFLDSSHLNNQRTMSAALQMQSAVDHFDDAPGYAHSGRSVSSYGHDSPATPHTINGDEQDISNLPKFERNLSDVYADELLAAQYTSHPMSKYTPTNTSLLSPYSRNSISERLQAANQAHQRSVSPHDRRPSPFRNGSPFAAPADFQSHMTSVRQQREANEMVYQQHHQQSNNAEPVTISPKDAVLEYHETPDEIDAPLFPDYGRSRYQMPAGVFQPPSLPASSSSEVPLYMQNSVRPGSSNNSMPEQTDLPAHLLSMETSASASDAGADNMESESRIQKPAGTLASRGAYTCTASGCTQRFETPGKLEKHRREFHRAQPTPSPRKSEPSDESEFERERIGSEMTSAALMQRNAQSGPHRCSRVNPNTGKPCNTVFSRPYDLTRHEDTIHNGIKKKVRCHLCTEEKTFSRSDALTRHMRVVHPDVDFPGKHRRRHI